MQKQVVVGIDVSKLKFDCCLLEVTGKIREECFPNTAKGFAALVRWAQVVESSDVQICMEATGRYWEDLANHLFALGWTVSVVQPACITGFRKSELKRSKTDKSDAALIARYCSTMKPRAWCPLSDEQRELQDLNRSLDVFKFTAAQEKVRLQSGLKSDTAQIAIRKHIEHLNMQIRELELAIAAHIKNHQSLHEIQELVSSIPGIGETTAAAFLSEIGTSLKFANHRQLTAFCGLDPREFQSGTSVRKKPRISKVGNARFRKALYFPAITAMRCNPVIMAFAARLRLKGKPEKVIICAVMRKLLVLIAGVVRTGRPFDPDYEKWQPVS